MLGGSSTELFENNDILFEILLRVNPESIFRCILVSKPWLKLLTSLSFREDYIKRWDWWGFDTKFIGFSYYFTGHVKHPCEFPAPPTVPIVPTCELGCVISRSKFLCDAGYFIGSTPDGLILSGEHPKKYFVCSLTTRQRIELPPLPVHYKDVSMAILSHEDDIFFDNFRKMRNFEVIYAKSTYMEEPDDNIVPILTFSSLTGEWRPSILCCTQNFALARGVGTVANGVVYWTARIGLITARIAAYNTKKKTRVDDDGIGRIVLMNKPFTVHDSASGKDHHSTLGVTSEGRLMYASLPYLRRISIWVLDHDDFENSSDAIDDDDSRWRLCYEIDIESMMIRNSAVLSECRIEIQDVFMFVAFFPGESDSIFLRCEKYIFIYHRDTQKLERITPYYLEDDSGSSSLTWQKWFLGWLRPLTLSEAWPSWLQTGKE